MQVRETLIAARNLIADPEHWTQGTYAIENTGLEVYPHESNAYAFCSVGAIIKASGAYMDDSGILRATPLYETCHADLGRAALELFNNANVIAINDGEVSEDPEHAHAEVMAMFDKAIANA